MVGWRWRGGPVGALIGMEESAIISRLHWLLGARYGGLILEPQGCYYRPLFTGKELLYV